MRQRLVVRPGLPACALKSRASRLFQVLLLVALALVSTTCGKKKAAPTSPESPPPQIESVFPAPRSTGVFYETEVWAQFATPLDPSTVNERTVFLKVDDARVPIDVQYESASRRIRITPRILLGLRQTHTVRLLSGITDLDGAQLGAVYSWQFTTNGVRRVGSPAPAVGTVDESPFVRLEWSGTEPEAGPVQYRVYSGDDSVAVAAHTTTFHDVTGAPRYLPRERWVNGTTVYWSVVSTNLISGDHLDGPVWRVAIMPAGAPIDSIMIGAEQWGYMNRLNTRPTCTASSMFSGSDYVCAVRYPLVNVPRDVKLAGASITLAGGASVAVLLPTLWASTTPWSGCVMAYPGPPFANEDLGKLADAAPIILGRVYYRFESDVLTSHVEAAIRWGGFYGYLVRSETNLAYSAITGEVVYPIRIYYYRSSAAGAARRP